MAFAASVSVKANVIQFPNVKKAACTILLGAKGRKSAQVIPLNPPQKPPYMNSYDFNTFISQSSAGLYIFIADQPEQGPLFSSRDKGAWHFLSQIELTPSSSFYIAAALAAPSIIDYRTEVTAKFEAYTHFKFNETEVAFFEVVNFLKSLSGSPHRPATPQEKLAIFRSANEVSRMRALLQLIKDPDHALKELVLNIEYDLNNPRLDLFDLRQKHAFFQEAVFRLSQYTKIKPNHQEKLQILISRLERLGALQALF